MADLFDGRLEDIRVPEHHNEDTTSNSRCLTDGRTFLWIYCDDDGLVSTITRHGGNAPQRILQAISEKFDVDIVSEYEPEFWGYKNQEEWDADTAARAEKNEQNFYNEVVKFVQQKECGIRPGTIGMIKAEIAKKLITENPDLLNESKRPNLIKAVERIYDRDHTITVTLSEKEVALTQMIATHEDDLPQA
jgi:hypothetical protein